MELLLKKAQEEKELLEPTFFSSLKNNNSSNKYPFETINIESDKLIYNGDKLVFGKLFEDIGCHKVFNKLFYFKALVISCILYNGSKLYMIDYLSYFKHIILQKELKKIEQKLNKNITKSDLKLSYYGKYFDIDDKCSI